MTAPDLADDQLSSLRPQWLLRHAEQLARRTGDTAVPRSVHARRSVSAAYYAVFHRLCINVSWSAVPTGVDKVRWELCRAFDHKAVENVARWVSGTAPPPTSAPGVAGLVASVATSTQIVTFSDGFIQLKGLRHDADYNHLKIFGRDLALAACKTAAYSIDALESVHGEPEWMTFVSLVLLKGTR